MASEVYLRHAATADTLYFTIRNTSRQMWNTAGTPNFETLTVANWTDYDVAMTESPASSYFYVGTFPAISGNMVAGWYFVEIFSRAGGSPAISDSLIASYFGYWNGTTFKFWADDVVHIEGVDATDQLADSLLDRTDGVETGITLRQAQRAQLAMLAGVIATAGSGTEEFKNPSGGTTRVTVTVDSSGNRSAVVINA